MVLHPLYLSKEVCPEHQWLQGQRYPVTGECILCARPAVFMETYRKERRARAKAAWDTRHSRRRAEIEGSPYYRGKVCAKHPELLGRRHLVSGRCVGCQPSCPAPGEAAAVRANLKAARESNQPFYQGAVCVKHPEIEGRRYTSSGHCVGCQRREGHPEYPAFHKTRRKAALEGGQLYYIGKWCKKHPELQGARYASNGCCYGCVNQRTKPAPPADNPNRYRGELCDKHPKEKGLRYKANNLCVACARERAKAQYERQKAKRNKEEVARVLEAQRQKPDER